MGRSDLYLLRLSEGLYPLGEPDRITFLPGVTAGPAWWPDGNSILFTFGGSQHNSTLWRMALRGPTQRPGEPERLPFGESGQFPMPAISRQGRVAYTQHFLAIPIMRLDLTRNGKVESLPMNSTRVNHVPQYSPDGKRIAFGSNRSGNHEIWVCNADGSNLMQLTSFRDKYVAEPAWSPDGRRIAFTCRHEIYTIGAEGGEPVRIFGIATAGPTWSRDGKWLYFSSDRAGSNQVWKIPAGGGDPVQITKQGGGYAVEPPDGRLIYFLRSYATGDNTELWQVPAGGGEERRIIDTVCPQYFSVVKRGIYFLSDWQDPFVRRFNFTTRKVETLTRLKGRMAYGISVSPDSRWLLYSVFAGSGSDLMLVENFQ